MKYKLVKYLLFLSVAALAACSSGESSEEAASEESSASVEDSQINSTPIGIQVYSVRDALKEDFEGTIQRVADIGYDYIEAYGLGTDGMIMGMKPEDYRKVVNDAGMEIHSVHAGYFTPDQAETMLAAGKALGVKYVVVPWMNEELREDYAATAQSLNESGKVFAGSGVKLAYHNHAFEFEDIVDGKHALEVMLENSEPENLMFQADLYWVTKGGANAVDFVKKYPGRFCSWHIKDAQEGTLDQTTVGTGVVDFAGVFAVEGTGAELFFVEDEREDDPFGNITAAYEFLSTADFID